MRDIDTIPVASDPADPAVDDAAYASPEGAGLINVDTTLTDPSFADTKAYGRPSLGGDFSPGGRTVLGADADGGAADLAADTTVTVEALTIPTPPNTMALGRAANNSSFLNLYPWFKDPKEGLDMNNPNPPPAADPPPTPPLAITGNTLVANTGSAHFAGPAAANAVITLTYAIDGGASQTLTINILAGDTTTQIGTKVRNAVDAVFGLDASGSGGNVTVVGLGGLLTAFHFTVS